VAGKANVLIFPDLNSSHIAFKMLRIVAGAETFGHHVLGLTRPATQVSSVSTPEMIFGAAICAAYQSITYRELIEHETWD
jgi:phosphotransacetylase